MRSGEMWGPIDPCEIDSSTLPLHAGDRGPSPLDQPPGTITEEDLTHLYREVDPEYKPVHRRRVDDVTPKHVGELAIAARYNLQNDQPLDYQPPAKCAPKAIGSFTA